MRKKLNTSRAQLQPPSLPNCPIVVLKICRKYVSPIWHCSRAVVVALCEQSAHTVSRVSRARTHVLLAPCCCVYRSLQAGSKMPWSDRAKRLLGQGSGQKRDDPKKNAGRTSGGGKAGEIQVKKGVGTALRTSFVLDQRHQQAVRNEDRDVSESTEQKNTELQAPLTPILNISPGHGSATREEPNNLTESSRGLQKATPLGPTRERLWDEAYDILCEKEPKLMKAYERDLLSCQTQDEKGISPVLIM